MSIYNLMWISLIAQGRMREMTRAEVMERYREPLSILVERGGEPGHDYVRFRSGPKRTLVVTIRFNGNHVIDTDFEHDFPDVSQASIITVRGIEGPVIARDSARCTVEAVAGAQVKILRPSHLPDGENWLIRHADPRNINQWVHVVATTDEVRRLLGIGDRLVQILKGPFRTNEEASVTSPQDGSSAPATENNDTNRI
ncbi:MAG: hypothetical protein IT445_13470 [Phycisphaeraceae bacterium]|nr:hypothetical protein [Phycisphaeraceae bacterium]